MLFFLIHITVITICDTWRQNSILAILTGISSIIDSVLHPDIAIADLKCRKNYGIYYYQESTISNRKQLSQNKRNSFSDLTPKAKISKQLHQTEKLLHSKINH